MMNDVIGDILNVENQTMSDETGKPNDNENYRLTRIYTRTGDKGFTRLASGREVPKNHPRLNAYGTLDELQVAIGAARDALAQAQAANPALDLSRLAAIAHHLTYFQQMLFTLCADLATPIEDRHPQSPVASEEHVRHLERLIDHYNEDLPPLKDFILPGGHPAGTSLHVCRVVCRRAEREIETLANAEPIGEWVIPLTNRFSDAFFVLARRVMFELQRAGVALDEQIWTRDAPPPEI